MTVFEFQSLLEREGDSLVCVIVIFLFPGAGRSCMGGYEVISWKSRDKGEFGCGVSEAGVSGRWLAGEESGREGLE